MKVTDFTPVTSASSGADLTLLLVNCHFLLSTLEHKNNVVWAVVALLTNICNSDR